MKNFTHMSDHSKNWILNSEPPHKPCGNFTLIELLLVVGIIAILASLILPALKTAKDIAKSANCSSNIRQIGFGAEMYSGDFDQWIIPGYQGVSGNWIYWYAVLRDNEYVKEDILDCPAQEGRDLLREPAFFSIVNMPVTFGCVEAPSPHLLSQPILPTRRLIL